MDYLYTNRRIGSIDDVCSATCTICGKSFPSRSNLKQHVACHSGKTVACQICGQEFVHKSNLSRHMKKHQSVKPFFCKLCNTGYTRSDLFKSHMMNHERK